MQEIFYTLATPEEYFHQSRKFPFPKPQKCLQPDCLISIPPKKHGFYSRNAIEPNFSERIDIRRYHCKYCGKTISYLPCFCLPYIQYTLETVFFGLVCHFSLEFSLAVCVKLFRAVSRYIYWTYQHLQFYASRFILNLKRIYIILRQLLPGVILPEPTEKGAQRVLYLVLTGFADIQTFSARFFEQGGRSFLAPCK